MANTEDPRGSTRSTLLLWVIPAIVTLLVLTGLLWWRASETPFQYSLY